MMTITQAEKDMEFESRRADYLDGAYVLHRMEPSDYGYMYSEEELWGYGTFDDAFHALESAINIQTHSDVADWAQRRRDLATPLSEM